MLVNMFDLTGKVALVTGANSGLGLAYARGLAKAGANVVIWGRNKAKNEAALADLRRFDPKASARVVDVASEEAVVEGMAAAAAAHGRLDCVIANAGFTTMAPSTVEMSSKMYHELLATNMHGAFFTLREGAKHMVARAKAGEPGGSLIICGSLSIFSGVNGMAHYAAAKGALNAMSKTLALELGQYQIRVNVIAPGFVITEMTREHPEILAHLDGIVSKRTPIGRSAVPEDFEGIAVYFASDASRYHTGDTVVIDGGQTTNIM